MKLRARTIKGFFVKEIIQILRDPKMIMAIFFIPVMQTIMFGLALTSEVKNIKFVVVSKPGKIAQELESRALASGWFTKVSGVNGAQVADPEELIASHKAEAVLVAPPEGFEKALERGSSPIQLLLNATNAQRAQQVNGYVQQIVAEVARENGYNLGGGLISLDMRVLFNHYMDTTSYMIPALLVMSTFIVLLVVGGMSLAKEKETGTMEKLIVSPCSVEEIMVGKTLPYFVIGLCIVGLILFIGVAGFGIPFRGDLWQIAVNSVLFTVSAMACALLISTVVHTQQQAMMASVLYLMPAILLSGVFFPVANIPAVFRWLCYLNPMMYSVLNFRAIILKGGDAGFFWQNCLWLAVLSVVLCTAAYKNFKSKLN